VLAPFQQRLVDEKTELDSKLERLNVFLASDMVTCDDSVVNAAEIERLQRQVKIMEEYSAVLAERIEAFADSIDWLRPPKLVDEKGR
jgi:hypothetical protein